MHEPRILALTDSLNPWHSFWVRVGQYLPALGTPFQIDHNFIAMHDRKSGRSVGLCDAKTGNWLNPEVIILYRYTPDSEAFLPSLQSAKASGTLLIADIDDDLWSPSRNLPLGRSEWPKQRVGQLTASLKICDVIRCSTPALAEMLSAMFPRCSVVMQPNTLPASVAAPNPSPTGCVKLGWSGAPWCRPNDLELLKPLAQWSQQRSEVHFVHLGHAEGRLSFAEALGVDPNRVITIPIQDHESYTKSLAFDVGLAPLDNSIFNHFKSDLKLIEYSGSSIAWAASDVEPYAQLARQWGQTDLICKTAHEFIEVVVRLLEPTVRQQKARELKELSGSRSFSHGVRGWQDLIGLCAQN